MEQMVSIFWAEPEWIIPPTDDTATALEAHDFSVSKFTERQIILYLWLGNLTECFVTGQRKMRGVDPEPVYKFPRCSWDDLWFTSVNRMLLCMTFCCYSSLVFQFRVPGALSLRGQLHSDLPVSLNKSWQSIFMLHFQEVTLDGRERSFNRIFLFSSTFQLKDSFWPWCIFSARSDKWHLCRVC